MVTRIMRRAIARLLQNNRNYQFEEADTGGTAYQKVEIFKPHIIILDIKMRGLFF